MSAYAITKVSADKKHDGFFDLHIQVFGDGASADERHVISLLNLITASTYSLLSKAGAEVGTSEHFEAFAAEMQKIYKEALHVVMEPIDENEVPIFDDSAVTRMKAL